MPEVKRYVPIRGMIEVIANERGDDTYTKNSDYSLLASKLTEAENPKLVERRPHNVVKQETREMTELDNSVIVDLDPLDDPERVFRRWTRIASPRATVYARFKAGRPNGIVLCFSPKLQNKHLDYTYTLLRPPLSVERLC
jgi:hypothetical protein